MPWYEEISLMGKKWAERPVRMRMHGMNVDAVSEVVASFIGESLFRFVRCAGKAVREEHST
jgi:hypothetical protein